MVEEHTLPNGRRVRFDKENHTYDLEVPAGSTLQASGTPAGEPTWLRVPSVTTILNVYHKPALVWWGMQVGVRGFLELLNDEGDLTNWHLCTDDQVVSKLTEKKLTVNHVRDSAATRGSTVHDALEKYVQTGFPIAPETGWHQAAVKFLAENKPVFRETEIIVASWREEWAGTPDALAEINGELWLLDYKTSKRVYETHYAQLAFYVQGLFECEYIGLQELTTLRQGVVHLKENGEYKLVENLHVGVQDVNRLLDGYRGFKALKPPKKKKGK